MRVTPMQTEDTIQIFIAAINNQNVEQIVELCTEDHRFIDAHGGVVTRDALRQAWTAYFAFMPIYRIETEAIISRDGMAAGFWWAWTRPGLTVAFGDGPVRGVRTLSMTEWRFGKSILIPRPSSIFCNSCK